MNNLNKLQKIMTTKMLSSVSCIEYGWHCGAKKYYLEEMRIMTKRYAVSDESSRYSVGWYGLGIKFYAPKQFQTILRGYNINL